MKKIFWFFLLTIIAISGCKKQDDITSFPNKPITIIVYTGPGGLIDITARKFVDIASKYSDVTFVVENKPGSGGIVAMKRLMQLPADGYTLFASTKSNIAKIVASDGEAYIEGIDWMAMMMADPECVITNRNISVNSWEEIFADAKSKGDNQLWLGPANGGLDHVTALKIWERAGMKAKWIPFKSGGKARAALLGEQGVAYVGNPREVLGNKNLQIAAISSAERLPQFPEVPTFKELGFSGLDNEFMWRGFVQKKGANSEVKDWYHQLFDDVNNDEEWREYWHRGGIDVVYKSREEFTKIVHKDKEDFRHYLQKIGIINQKSDSFMSSLASGRILKFIISMMIAFFFLLWFFIKQKKSNYLEGILLPLLFIMISSVFFLISFSFPNTEKVGPAVIPRLWISILIPLNIYLIINVLYRKKEIIQEDKNRKMVYIFIGLLSFYLISIYYIGYFISSFIFLFVAIYLLGYRKYFQMIIISTFWVLFSYLVFYKLLYVPLPIGKLIEMFF